MTHLTIQQLVAHTDGELSGPSLKLVEKHIGECGACARELYRLAEQDRLLVSIIATDPGEAFFETLAESIEQEISGRKKAAQGSPAAAATLRPAPAPMASGVEPRPEPPAAIMPPAPRPATPPAPLPAPAPAPAPRPMPRLEPRPAPAPAASGLAPRSEPAAASAKHPPRPRRALSSLMIGVGAFIAGLAVAILVVLRLTGVEITFEPHVVTRPLPRTGPAPGSHTVAATPASPPAPAPAAVADTSASVQAPPVAAVLPPTAPVPAAPARRPRHTPAHSTGATASPTPTVVVPVQVIHTETASAPAAPQPAPEAQPSIDTDTQLGILCGQVRDSDGHPVARAQVMMTDVGVIALTDRTGRFCLAAPVGDRTMSVMALGFTSTRRLVSLNKRTPEMVITLKTSAPYPMPH